MSDDILYRCVFCVFFFFKQKTAYEMCGRDWSSDVCSSDLYREEGNLQSSCFNCTISRIGYADAVDVTVAPNAMIHVCETS